MTKKNVTFRQVVHAIRDHTEIPKAYGEFFRDALTGEDIDYDDGPADDEGRAAIGAACAIGQAAIKLNVKAESLWNALGALHTDPDNVYAHVGSTIAEWNDKTRMTLEEIALMAKKEFGKYMDTVLEVDDRSYRKDTIEGEIVYFDMGY